mmetsp:Transcript_40932/g.107491  ORF Transcript_40932/g.107491 Transcript_40932/m.107491 type:complete len:428 (-) Transcript_40932:115-1398(-)
MLRGETHDLLLQRQVHPLPRVCVDPPRFYTAFLIPHRCGKIPRGQHLSQSPAHRAPTHVPGSLPGLPALGHALGIRGQRGRRKSLRALQLRQLRAEFAPSAGVLAVTVPRRCPWVAGSLGACTRRHERPPGLGCGAHLCLARAGQGWSNSCGGRSPDAPQSSNPNPLCWAHEGPVPDPGHGASCEAPRRLRRSLALRTTGPLALEATPTRHLKHSNRKEGAGLRIMVSAGRNAEGQPIPQPGPYRTRVKDSTPCGPLVQLLQRAKYISYFLFRLVLQIGHCGLLYHVKHLLVHHNARPAQSERGLRPHLLGLLVPRLPGRLQHVAHELLLTRKKPSQNLPAGGQQRSHRRAKLDTTGNHQASGGRLVGSSPHVEILNQVKSPMPRGLTDPQRPPLLIGLHDQLPKPAEVMIRNSPSPAAQGVPRPYR